MRAGYIGQKGSQYVYINTGRRRSIDGTLSTHMPYTFRTLRDIYHEGY